MHEEIGEQYYFLRCFLSRSSAETCSEEPATLPLKRKLLQSEAKSSLTC